jgi:hypothetical protein
MVAPLSPAKQTANGRQSIFLVPTISNMSAPTATEVNAGLDVTGYLLDDFEGITLNTNKVTLPGVMLETTSTEIAGETTISSGPLILTTDPQASNSDDKKKPWKLLYIDGANNWSGYIVERQNVAGTTGTATAGQFVNVASVTVTNGVMKRSSNGAEGIWVSQHDVSVTKYVPGVALA